MTVPTLTGAEERPPEPAAPGPQPGAARANLYVARMLQQHLVDDPSAKSWAGDGSAVLVDISGFTKLSEALARKGREGAEQITELIGHIFELMLAVAYDSGGSLLKFGGDSLLLWFEGEGHAPRACRSTLLMRDILRDVGAVELPGVSATLRMSQGVHSGRFHFFRGGQRASGASSGRPGMEPAGRDAARRGARSDSGQRGNGRAAAARLRR